ncbi:uncharacterized protein B0P05DRAFT_550394 [Gilbertella persicaria]|uniref:uncharacterized protein n=1 Tax=Gilbertella persicaria TaxID=101096 RepID=UPI00221F2CFC|nr:uncharacterized protein B0P05DRAFT_551074 [Gilbertella persicaria]XP_051432831.1 uncharacterized protein B0P05DRAFT_550394 [Gilbertella persicaria]KAI8069827.1 hypothetical protein B0P05DRAFT_551074 [Gilbertella persicaria]KAI8070614.1 hypothetical protein B0P05DRAFT_550394 [Gilbertella persicaria]
MDYEEEVDPFNTSSLMTARYRLIQERFPTESTEELDTQMEDISEGLAVENIMSTLTNKKQFSSILIESNS